MSRETYSQVKKGHLVPRAYQALFAVDDQVAVHVPPRSDHVVMHVKDAGTRSRYYRRTRPDGTQIDDTEASLSVLEDKAIPVLKEVVDGATLTWERKAALAQLFAMQMVRVPAFFASRKQTIEGLVKSLSTDHVKPRLIEETGGDMQLIRERVTELFTDSTQRSKSMRTLSIKISAILGSMRWHVLRFDDPVVAYSDQPVVVWPLRCRAHQAPPPEPTFRPIEALEVAVPLSPHLILLMTWVDEPDRVHTSVDTCYAAAFNALVSAQADKQWMHYPNLEPPIAQGVIHPLSGGFESAYGPGAVEASDRRARTARYLDRVRHKKHINNIEILTVERRAS